jgi:DNA-binding CsgD family transcriptional regulator
LMEDEEEYVFYARELYLAALRAEADAAERARAAGDSDAEDEARRSGHAMSARMHDLVESASVEGPPPPQAVADLAQVDAELARLEGRADPALWRAAAAGNERIGNSVAVAYARMREAEGLLEAGDRADAATALREAHAIAGEAGAEPLRQTCEALGRRSRIAVGPEAGDGARSASDDPFGLTPREREVLALVAAGRTNRQIGEELFMSEKTASVHVSRILAKLEVRTRGEAGAVAHKLGLDASPR